MRKLYVVLVLLCFVSVPAFAQPSVLGTQLINGTYTTYDLNNVGLFKQIRLQATSAAAISNRNWEFASGTAASTDYSINWRPNTGGNTLSANTFIPTSFANGAKYNSGFGGASGLLPAITANNYYTFNVYKNAAADNIMQLLETTFNPVSISTVTQNPISPVPSNNVVTVTITTATAPVAGENIFVRYSTDGFVTSTLMQAGFVGSTGTTIIPCGSAAVVYYVYSSNKTLAQINADVVTNGQAAHDMSTLNLNNNGGGNYTYTIAAASTNFSGAYFIPSTCYPSVASFVTAINGGAVTSPVTVNVAAGFTEPAIPATGISLTATGTAANPIIFKKSGVGVNPTINAAVGTATPASAAPDGMFRLNGCDYVTIDGFTFTDGNVTNPATMEYGIGLFKNSATDGANNNTIQNCTFNMQRTNNAGATAPMLDGAVGILVINATAAAAVALITPTSTAGTNSNNKFYSNIINGGNIGIGLSGYAALTPFILGDVNNDIGGTSIATGNTILNFGGGAATNPAAGIRANNQFGTVNISYNIINNNNGSGVNHATTLRGIYAQAGTSANINITNNTVTVKSAATTSSLTAIENVIGSTAAANTVNINSNAIQNCTYTTATTGTFTAILTTASAANVNTNNNTINNNSIGTAAVASAAVFQGIYNNGSSTNYIANGNTITNNSILNNGGTMYCLRGSTSLLTWNNNIINTNSIPNSAGTLAGTIYGMYDLSSPTQENFSGNQINNLAITGSTTSTACIVAGIYLNTTATSVKNWVSNNINTLTFSNSSTGASIIYGMYTASGSTILLSKNKIYSFSAAGASSTAHGIYMVSGTTLTAQNNYIGDLRTPAANAAIPLAGINVAGGTAANLYYNTIYLNATSTGALFGSSALYASSTTTITLRNNILVNASTGVGATGFSAAYRRSGAFSATNYDPSSNNNLFYAGVPSANNLISYDGTTSNQTLAAYKTQVGTRDAASITENPNFLSITGSVATYLHINPATATQIESGAVNIVGITDDYDADIRQGNAGYAGTGTAPDMGADEFAGITPAPSVVFVSAAPTTIAQCVKANRLITVTATTLGGTTITGVVINYSHNAVAQTPIVMTNTSGTTWQGTMLAPTTGNATVTWNVVATNSVPLTATYAGTGYSDEPLTGVTATATANSTIICSGANSILLATLVKSGSSLVAAGLAATTASSYSNPIYSNWANNKNQILFLASELTASGFSAGNLTAMSFPITSTSVTSRTAYTIRIGTTALNALTTASFVAPSFTTVYSANYVPFVGVNSFTFTTPFAWDGVSNIVVETCWDNTASTATESSTATAQITPFNSVISYNRTSTTGISICGLSVIPITAYTNRPQITFTGNLTPTPTAFSWSDGTSTVGSTNPLIVSPTISTSYTATITASGCNINTNAVLVTVNPLPTAPTGTNSSQCGAGVPTASVADLNGFTTPTFKWYAAMTGGVALQSNTSATYLASVSTVGINNFYVSVTNPSTGCESVRTLVTVTVSTPAAFAITNGSGATQAACNGAYTLVSVTAATVANYPTYTWSSNVANTLFSDNVGTPYVALANSTSVYVKNTTSGAITLTGNATDGTCSAVDNTIIFVQPASATIAAPTSTYCLSGTPTISATPAIGYAVGSLQWQNSTTSLAGPWADIVGATSATYTAGTALTTTTYYQLLIKDASGASCLMPQATITINNPMAASLGDVTRCGTGTVNLAVTSSAGSTVNWYAAASGGVSLGTGATFTTPSISVTTPYYADASIVGTAITSTIGAAATLTGATTQPTAFCNRWTSYHHQYIYTAAELIAAGFGAGNIQSMAYNITTLGDAATNNNFTVKIGNTALSTYTVFVNTGLTTVYGPSTYTHTASGVQTITFATPYTWDGVSNILVDVTMDGANSINNSITYFTATGSAMGGYSTNGNATATTTTSRLNTTFTIQSVCASSPRTTVQAIVTIAPAFAITNPAPATLAVCNGATTQFDATYTAGDYSTVTWTTTNGNLFTDAAATVAYVAGANANTVYLVATTAGAAIVTANAGNGGGATCSSISTKTLTILPATLIATASPAAICVSGTTTLSLAPSTAASYTGATIQWQSSPDGSTSWTDIAGANALTYTTPTISATSYYRATIINTAAVVCSNTSNVLTILVNNPTILTTTPGTRCGIGTVVLGATASAVATLNWYAASSGGVALGTGNSFTTPSINATTSYYVSAAQGTTTSNVTVGPASPTAQGGTIGTQTVNWDVNFTTLVSTTLTSVDIFPITAGQAGVIQVRSGTGSAGPILATINYTTTVGGGATVQTIPINFLITTPGNYALYTTLPTAGVSRNTSAAVYPYPAAATVARITSNGFDATYFMGMYNWQFSATTTCESPRTLVTATVTPPPAITPPANTAICSGNSTNLTVTSGNAGYTYSWSPAAGLNTTTGATVTANPATTQTYTITATDAGSGCNTTGTVIVTVNPVPTAVTVTPATATICANTIQSLVASGGALTNLTILNENFNGLAPGWTQVNNSTLGTPANAAWGFYTSGAIASNDNSNYIGSNSDAQGSGSTTATILYSPVFNLTNYSTANLNFYQYYRSQALSTDFARVEVTTNGGASWTNLATYTNTSQGSALLFLNTNLSLTPFVGNASVQIRFKYDASWDWYWFIDNVTISGNQNTTTTWSPATGLYTNAAATTPYVAGAAATTVYVKTAASQLYTATATSAAGCPGSNTTNITITPQPNATIAYLGTPYCAGGTATVTALGVGNSGGTYTSTAGLVINASAGDVDLTTSSAGTYTITYTLAAAGGCTIYTTTTAITIKTSGTWLGVDNNWNNPANWCGGLPTAATNVTIPAGLGNYPIIVSGISASANNISIATGASAIVSGTGVFNLYGAIANAGTFNLTDGALNMAGTSPQILAGTSISSGLVKNLTLSNSTGISLSSALAVTDSVSFGTSNVTFTTNDNLTLISNATSTARVADITHAGAVAVSGNSIVGKVSIERYLRAFKSWRLLATPIVGGAGTATINESWREGGTALTANGYGTRITGPGAIAFPAGVDEYTLRGSMKSYNMTNNVYDEITSADLAANKTIANDQGYYVFVRGDRGVAVPDAAGTTTLRMKGQIRTGNQIFNVTANKFQSIGNPFPSQIDFKKVTLSPEMVESFYIWNPAGGYYGVGQFEVYIKQTPGDPSSDFLKNGTGAILNTLESGQAVFVQNGNATTNGSVTIKETDKSIGSNLVSRVGINVPTLEINLFSKNSTGENYLADGTALNFNANYSNNIDNKDVRKINNAVDNIAVKNAGTLLVVDRHASLMATDTIFLNLSNTRVAPYRFEIDPSVLNNTGLEAFLKDKYLQTTTAVSLTDVTNVPFDITADAASKAADRFMIVFKQAPTLNFTTIAATRNADKTITINWGIKNERNVSTYSVEHSNDGINFSVLVAQTALANNGSNPTYSKLDITATKANNWYRIKANVANGAAQYSGIAMVAALPADQLDKPVIAVNPNPVEDKMVRIKFTNKAGSYTVTMVNSAGKTVYTGSIIVAGTAEVKTIALAKATAAGQYQLTLTAPDGSKELLRVVVL